MAKKYEFKPDKTGTGFFRKLYLTPKQRKSILRWALYALVLLALSVLQDVVLCRLDILGATTELVPCGILLICMVEGSEKGSIFSLVASALYLFSGSAQGYYCMVFIVFLAIFFAIFRQAFLQKGFLATLLCVSLAMLIYLYLNFAMALFLGRTVAARWLAPLIGAGLNLPAMGILYPICTAIEALGGDTWKE